jgi:hypothetical protein
MNELHHNLAVSMVISRFHNFYYFLFEEQLNFRHCIAG